MIAAGERSGTDRGGRRAWFVGPQHDYVVVVGQSLAVEPDSIGRLPRPVASDVELEILADALAVVRA